MAPQHHELTPRLLNGLYTEAMVLADEARAHFGRDGAVVGLPAEISVAYSCESLKVTTRLMHSIAWLLNQKAMMAGEIADTEMDRGSYELGYAPASDHYLVDRFPEQAQELIAASEDLYFRIQRVSNGLLRMAAEVPQQHVMIERLRQAF